MVSSCSAVNCTNRCTPENKAKGISFHRIPKCPDLRLRWAWAIRREGEVRGSLWIPGDSIVLCSQHFSEKDFEVYQCTKRLRPNVIPSIFDFSTDQPKSAKPPSLPQQKVATCSMEKLVCCVPSCGTTSEESDPFITFHEFPSHPDLCAKWIQQINDGISFYQKPMWVPRGKSLICSKHFVETAFKDDSDSLKPRAIPTIFGHRYIGFNDKRNSVQTQAAKTSDSPLIFKLVKLSAVKEKCLNTINQNVSFEAFPSHSQTSANSVTGLDLLLKSNQQCLGGTEIEESDDNDDFEMDVSPSINISFSSNNTVPSASSERDNDNTPTKSKIAHNSKKNPAVFKANKPKKMNKTKYLNLLKLKSGIIETLMFKVASLTKKIENLGGKYRSHERHMSSSFIKKVAVIRKNASRGDACATYILEQINGYNEGYMHWSDSTLSQCAIWVKKASYAYDYFKKAEIVKLPCITTIKRFIKSHPEMNFRNKNLLHSSDDSSSDFDFDSDGGEECQKSSNNKENFNVSTSCKTVLTELSASSIPMASQGEAKQNSTSAENPSNFIDETFHYVPQHTKEDNLQVEQETEISILPVNTDGSSSEVEIISPSGEVLRCYASNICNSSDGSQYYLIPNNQNLEGNCIVKSSENYLSVTPQNFENSVLPSQPDLIVTNNSSV